MILFAAIASAFMGRAELQMENIALRQQLAVLGQKTPRPRLRFWDRLFWVMLSRLWSRWRDALVIVKPETVIAWHRLGFRLFWRWKSRQKRAGRPPTPGEVRDLIRRMCRENPLWGAPRIHGELLKLGIDVSQATVSRYMVRPRKPPSQTWRTFLDNHIDRLASMDFLVVRVARLRHDVPTAAFRLRYVFVVLSHERRRIVHLGVTEHPTSAWVAQQIREAFPWGTTPRYLIRDPDAIDGPEVRATLKAMGIKEVNTAPHSPWQNPFVERLIGSIRRDCLDHAIVLNEAHLRRILQSYSRYDHTGRTHPALAKDTPDGRPIQARDRGGTIVAFPQVGGLHHGYERRAA